MSVIRIKKLRDSAKIPERATSGSAGMDLHACIDESVTVMPGECVKFPTGIAVALESERYAAFVFARSGLAIKHGLSPANCVGVIDSDYRGEVTVGIINHFKEPYTVEPGERIAQLVVMPVDIPEIKLCEELDETARGEGGFGSTGKD